MHIKDHILKEDNVMVKSSPNHGGKFGSGLPDTIIIHFTAGGSAESAVNILCNPKYKVSAHLVIGRDNSITQLVPFDMIAWHAGKSSYHGRTGFNRYSIGIEIDNAGLLTKSSAGYTSWFGRTYHDEDVVKGVHRNQSEPAYWHRYTEEQIAIVHDICVALVDTYRISSILGHEEIAPMRKIDPGPAFPLDKLRERALYQDRGDDGEEKPLPLQKPGQVTASKLNIRSSPSVNAVTIAPPLSQGTIVNIEQETNGWYEVEVRIRGWVKKDYIKT